MIRVTSSIDGPPLTFNATVNGLAIYLDNHSLINLAKHSSSIRNRFLNALRSRGDLLFSVTNAVDLTGPLGRSREAVRAFLDEIGPHWFPVELDPFEVVKRELDGAPPAKSCISTKFMKDYFTDRIAGYSRESTKIIGLSEDFFRLGSVLDWVGPQRDSIRKGMGDLDAALIKRIAAYRVEFEHSHEWLDRHFPPLPFNPLMPATFAYCHLIRTLVVNAKAQRLKEGDGVDFCHAVMASSFASVATLDKHWKRRIEGLPGPKQLARIYYAPELDRMVAEIESWTTKAAYA